MVSLYNTINLRCLLFNLTRKNQNRKWLIKSSQSRCMPLKSWHFFFQEEEHPRRCAIPRDGRYGTDKWREQKVCRRRGVRIEQIFGLGDRSNESNEQYSTVLQRML
jgi:hypothetical protein